MTVTDGALDGTGIDKIRMKIFNKNTGVIIYDNQPGASDAEAPETAVGTNSSIVIHGTAPGSELTTNAKAGNTESVEKAETLSKLELVAYPNPGNKHFTIQVKSFDLTTKLTMQVFDQYGRLLDKRENLIAGSTIQLGELYRAGVYFVRITQGIKHSEVKLVKSSN